MFIGAALPAFLGILAWPDLLIVLVSVGLAAGMVIAGVWIHLTLPDAETEENPNSDQAEPQDLTMASETSACPSAQNAHDSRRLGMATLAPRNVIP